MNDSSVVHDRKASRGRPPRREREGPAPKVVIQRKITCGSHRGKQWRLFDKTDWTYLPVLALVIASQYCGSWSGRRNRLVYCNHSDSDETGLKNVVSELTYLFIPRPMHGLYASCSQTKSVFETNMTDSLHCLNGIWSSCKQTRKGQSFSWHAL